MKYMNSKRYFFYLYIILNEFNKIKISGKLNSLNRVDFQITKQKKRNFNEINSDDEYDYDEN